MRIAKLIVFGGADEQKAIKTFQVFLIYFIARVR